LEQRDFATTNDMVYEKRVDTETIIASQRFEGDLRQTRSKQQVNTAQSDLPTMFGLLSGRPLLPRLSTHSLQLHLGWGFSK